MAECFVTAALICSFLPGDSNANTVAIVGICSSMLVTVSRLKVEGVDITE
jgi:hypothetical protein